MGERLESRDAAGAMLLSLPGMLSILPGSADLRWTGGGKFQRGTFAKDQARGIIRRWQRAEAQHPNTLPRASGMILSGRPLANDFSRPADVAGWFHSAHTGLFLADAKWLRFGESPWPRRFRLIGIFSYRSRLT